MGSSNIRDILTAFSPSLDYFAFSSGDDIVSSEATSINAKSERGKLGSSLLVLGTGSGDVLALDVSAGQLKWKFSGCHPGGVSAIAFATNASCIYSAGVDGMVCEIDSLMRNLLRKFRASTKSISCLTVSPDGKALVTAAAQLKTFDCSNHKKIQKFTGHPINGKFILSSAAAERYIAVWKAEGRKKQSAICVLAMEHPAVFIDSKCVNEEIYVSAISETGVCYFWYGQDIETLRNAKPTKLSISLEDGLSKPHKGALPTIFAAKLQGVAKLASVHAFLAHGFLVKPLFQKIVVQCGSDILLSSSQDGVLLPRSQPLNKSKKGLNTLNRVIALFRANVEDVTLPIPKIFNLHEGKVDRRRSLRVDTNDVMTDSIDPRSQPEFVDGKDLLERFVNLIKVVTIAICNLSIPGFF
ncbi:hypothetical protein F3Y22_tig00110895pilonHSYRG00462 [Hibiscus syriacus]|uniref:Uncharacterized protein n=1 Tax=Hibiscus syriacus TaxID=106335 RepID=A0A6A2ZEZ9_HIBSY|nr:hypothetical protein F3Y22_tig00110895pilonHSYRG00462 [Hibiscus syriacus]